MAIIAPVFIMRNTINLNFNVSKPWKIPNEEHINAKVKFQNNEETLDSDRIIVFVGPTGVGKSRLINYLVREDIMDSKMSIQSVSQDLNYLYVNVHSKGIVMEWETNRKYYFVDTQGLCDTKLPNDRVLKLIEKGLSKGVKYVSRFCICLRNGRFTDEQKGAISDIIDKFDLLKNNRKQNVMIIITHCDNLSEKYINNVIAEYLKDPMIKSLTNYVKNQDGNYEVVNILPVGLPDLENLDDEIKMIYEKRLKEQFQRLWNIMGSNYDPITATDGCQIL